MKKLIELSKEDIEREMDKIRVESELNYKYLHQNRRWKALLNEKVRRSGLNIK